MKTYTNKAYDKLVDKWNNLGGNIDIIEDGSLASVGLAIFTKKGYKSIVIKEVYLNDWSSCLGVTQYKKLPKKYNKLISV
jgi:hypothetical protein